MPESSVQGVSEGRTLLLALWVPGIVADTDPDMLADEFAVILNEERDRNGGYGGPVEVSLIPSPQWLSPGVLARLVEFRRITSEEAT